jgi:hypothetical protein
VEMVVEVTAINFILNKLMVEVVVDTTDSILDQILTLINVAVSVAVEIRVFPSVLNTFAIEVDTNDKVLDLLRLSPWM